MTEEMGKGKYKGSEYRIDGLGGIEIGNIEDPADNSITILSGKYQNLIWSKQH